jgi:hypothetical protein
VRRIVNLDDRKIEVEKMTDDEEARIKGIATQMATYVNGEDFNMVLNAVTLFISAILEMTDTDEEEARFIMENMKMAVICRTYDIGEENTVQ